MEKVITKGIGPSDCVAIAGLSSYTSRFEVYMKKTGQHEEKKEESENAYWSSKFRPALAEEFARRSKLVVKKVPDEERIQRHPERDYMIGIREYVVKEEDGKEGLLDLRCTNEFHRREWDDNKVPIENRFRIQHNLAVFGYDFAYVGVLIGGNTFKYKRVEKDEAMIDTIYSLVDEFWQHVEKEEPPELDGSKACTEYIKRKYQEVEEETEIPLPKQAMEVIEAYRKAKEEEKRAKEAKDKAANQIKAMMGHNEISYLGSHLFKWRKVETNRFDEKRFKDEHPDLYENYIKKSAYRRFEYKEGY